MPLPARPTRVRQLLACLGPVLACLGLLLAIATVPACGKVEADRAAAEQNAKALEAIQKYSAASERANDAHKAVLQAFAAANQSTSLTDYKAALLTKVLPAMDEFVRQLQAMPTDTPELKAIHAKLVWAYQDARRQLDEFGSGLEDASGLARFDEIRGGLQQSVRTYRTELATYYSRFDRQLRSDGTAAVPLSRAPTATQAGAVPSAATPSPTIAP